MEPSFANSAVPTAPQIFISYARDDDESPPDEPSVKGFVTYLHDQLQFELKQLGEPRPALWRDRQRIERGDQFEPYLVEALEKSSLLLVVLSRNWMARGWCRRELDEFVKRFREKDGQTLRGRIVVVGKNDVARTDRPEWLQGQEGYDLFSIDRESSEEMDFFVRGKIVNPRYLDRLRELARYLWKRAKEANPETEVPPPDPPTVAGLADGRSVFLARPAGDMVQAHDTLVRELRGRGYQVVPEPDMPRDGSEAVKLIDEALATAELSIHLLGQKSGFAPDGAKQAIVPLQLARAAEHVGRAVSETAGDTRRFHRIIWAPRSLPEQGIADRDPVLVLAGVGDCREGDQLVADTLVALSQFVIQHLEANAPRPAHVEPLPKDGAKVYIRYLAADSAYGEGVAETLYQAGHEPWMPAFDGEEDERNKVHNTYLANCDAVVLCWANASDAWIKSNAAELRKWYDLGRKTPFHCRGVVAGPPPQQPKNMFRRIPPRTDIDLVNDATEFSAPTPEALQPLLERLAADVK